MIYTSDAIEKLVEVLATLPSIGRKTAQRLTLHILRQSDEFVNSFADALKDLKQKVKYCSECFNYTESDPCPICSSGRRDTSVICVVEEPSDVIAIEKTEEFYGMYHVLHGAISPLDGISPNDLKIRELIERCANVSEVILALNPSVEGEVTTQYIAKHLKSLDIKVTRIARGIPVGSSLEFTDEATLSRALLGRVEV
jgi:recombination protein RecR